MRASKPRQRNEKQKKKEKKKRKKSGGKKERKKEKGKKEEKKEGGREKRFAYRRRTMEFDAGEAVGSLIEKVKTSCLGEGVN